MFFFLDYVHPDFKIDKEETPSFKENKKPSDANSTITNNSQTNRSSSNQQKSFRPEYEDHLDDDEVFMQYATQDYQHIPSETSTIQQKTSESKLQNEDLDDDKDEDATFDEDKILAGHSFTIVHFVNEQVAHLTQLIQSLGGQVINGKHADYAISPMNILSDKTAAKENVSLIMVIVAVFIIQKKLVVVILKVC